MLSKYAEYKDVYKQLIKHALSENIKYQPTLGRDILQKYQIDKISNELDITNIGSGVSLKDLLAKMSAASDTPLGRMLMAGKLALGLKQNQKQQLVDDKDIGTPDAVDKKWIDSIPISTGNNPAAEFTPQTKLPYGNAKVPNIKNPELPAPNALMRNLNGGR